MSNETVLTAREEKALAKLHGFTRSVPDLFRPTKSRGRCYFENDTERVREFYPGAWLRGEIPWQVLPEPARLANNTLYPSLEHALTKKCGLSWDLYHKTEKTNG